MFSQFVGMMEKADRMKGGGYWEGDLITLLFVTKRANQISNGPRRTRALEHNLLSLFLFLFKFAGLLSIYWRL